MNFLNFESQIIRIKEWYIVKLPLITSNKLSSRSMNMAMISTDENTFIVPLEPDGAGGHWFRINENIGLKNDIIYKFVITLLPSHSWPEPEIPTDLLITLKSNNVFFKWDDLTIKARWEWIRWIRSTKVETTREKRILTTCSMLADGKKRPCCFNSSQCTVQYVSTKGILNSTS